MVPIKSLEIQIEDAIETDIDAMIEDAHQYDAPEQIELFEGEE